MENARILGKNEQKLIDLLGLVWRDDWDIFVEENKEYGPEYIFGLKFIFAGEIITEKVKICSIRNDGEYLILTGTFG